MNRSAGLDSARQILPDASLLSTWPAGPGERRFALAVVLVSAAFFVVAAPFAKQPLTPVWGFIPIYEAALIVNDLITAILLFGQFRIARSKALLVLASGYVFTALITIAHALTFPGLFAPGGLIGAGPQSTAWLYMLWHVGFPMFVVAYALLSGGARQALPHGVGGGRAIAGALAATVALVLACTVLATGGQDALPAIMVGNRYTPVMIGVVTTVWLASGVALVLLSRRRPYVVLDLWLMVVMCAWLFDIALSAMLNAGRFDLGFYAGRAYGLLASSFVLGVLLLENGLLHARLARAHAHEQQRAADLQRLSERLELANAQLGDSNRQLQEQTRLKSEFLANMSHELRTPLNAVIGFSEILKTGMAEDKDKQRRFAGHIYQSGHHLLALINDILDLSKIEASKVEIALEPVHLKSALDDALGLVANQAHAKRINLTVEERGSVGPLRADQRRLKQILLNLLSNALKFTPEQGRVTLAAEEVDRERASTAVPGYRDGLRMPLAANEFERFVEISVTDTGVGLAPEDLRRLFTPFTQIANPLTAQHEGTGLGLVMVQRLAELHGGAVAVSTEAGRGSCFTVWLPRRTEERPMAPVSVQAEPSRRPLALVIEDNEQAAELMQEQLEATGFAVRRAASAEAALAMADDFSPALITLDILLPGMDGWQFLARLRETSRWEGVPVVVVSVVADRGMGFSLGAALILQKPIRRDALSRGLERLGLAPNAQRKVTVLVIDDDAEAVELLATQLQQRHYGVLRALGGREGIELAQRHRPDLIALDLEMPEVNGFEVVEALKDDQSTAHIPIVIVTAKDLTPSDRSQLNGHILEIVDKADFKHGRFVGEVQRAMSRVT